MAFSPLFPKISDTSGNPKYSFTYGDKLTDDLDLWFDMNNLTFHCMSLIYLFTEN